MVIDIEAACADLPVFPLPQVVLFPRALLPLHIFEPRYRAMVKDALATHKAIAVAHLLEGDRFADVAGVGLIVEHQELPDGRSNILLHGQARVRLTELPFVPPYRRARGAVLADVVTPVPDSDKTALLATAAAFVADVARRNPRFSFDLPRSIEPAGVADLCAHHLVVDAAARQRILEELDVAARVQAVIRELASQHGDMLREGGGSLN